MRGVVRWLRSSISSASPATRAFTSTVTAPAASHDATLPLPSHRSPLEVGARFGRYEVLGLIGTGGMGAVYEAYDPELARPVAIKVVAPSPRPELAQLRLQREAQTMARLSDPNIATVLDIGRIDDQLFIAMELVRGGTLRALVGTKRPFRDLLALLLSAGRGLATAHAAGVIHRDFKPDNVLLGAGGIVRVSDFGLARGPRGESSADEPMARTHIFGGTPAYLAPEGHAGVASSSTDQFAFAVTIYEVLEGVRPYGASDLVAYAREPSGLVRRSWERRDAPRTLRAVVDRGLALDPAARWPSVEMMCRALERAARRARWPWLVATVAVAALILGFVALQRQSRPTFDGSGCRLDNIPVRLRGGGPIHIGGRDPSRIAIGHIDLDPFLDVAASYSFTKSLSIWRGRGDGTLIDGPVLEVGRGATAIVIAEIDRDHRPDLVVAAYREFGSELAVLRGTAEDGTFAPALRTTTACDPGTREPVPLQLVTRDLDADGSLDLAAANNHEGVCVLYGHGDGTFDRRQHLPLPGQAMSVATLDMDADGRPDLVATVRTGGAVMFRNTGAGFVEVGFVPAGTDSRAIAAGDLDRDGRDDFVIAHRADANVTVHLAAQSFRATFYPTHAFPEFVAMADLNGDCRLDVALTYSTGFTSSRDLTIMRGDGTGKLLPAEHLGGGDQSSFAIGDLDGDRRNDIVINAAIAERLQLKSGTGGLTVLRNVTGD